MTRPVLATPRCERRARGAILAATLLVAACHGSPSPPAPPSPPPAAIVVAAGALVTTEGGTGASFDAVLASTPAATVEVEVRSGDTTEGLVFAPGYAGPAASREITFTPQDWDVPRRVVVQPLDDRAADGSVTYPVTLRVAYSEDAAYAAVPRAEVGVTNLDDDTAGITVVPEGGAPLRTDEDGTTAALAIWLACAPAGTVQVPVTVGDATEGLVLGGSSPWVPQSSVTVTFTPFDWETPRMVSVVGRPDGEADGDQSYLVTVGPASGDLAYAALPAQTVPVVNAHSEWIASSDVPKAIADYPSPAATSVLAVGNASTALSKVIVRVNITHTFDADLALHLVAPSGTTVLLASHVGGGNDNFTNTVFDDSAATPITSGSAPFTGTYRPALPLSALVGQNANGTWTLRVEDTASGDSGTVVGWALRLE